MPMHFSPLHKHSPMETVRRTRDPLGLLRVKADDAEYRAYTWYAAGVEEAKKLATKLATIYLLSFCVHGGSGKVIARVPW